LVGVARNPLRDGAPPTGSRFDNVQVAPFRARPPRKASSTKPQALISSSPRVSRGSTWMGACEGRPLSDDSQGFGIRQKTMQFTHQRRKTNQAAFSSRGRFDELSASPPMSRGACLAPMRAWSTSVRPRSTSFWAASPCERSETYVDRCRSLRVTALGVGVETTADENEQSKIPWSNGRARTLSSAKESEATSETGSFRRHAPVAA